MEGYFQYFTVICLALVTFSYGEDHAIKSTTTWDVTKKVEDCKRQAKKFDMVTVKYVARVKGKDEPFDTVTTPLEFQTGLQEVIMGLDHGVRGMCVGEKRTLHIPSREAYAVEGVVGHKIPPNADLVYEVEMVKIADGEVPPDVFGEIDVDNNRKLDRKEMFNYLKARGKAYGLEGDDHDTEHAGAVENMFQAEDFDKDGGISHKEFSGPKHEPTARDEL